MYNQESYNRHGDWYNQHFPTRDSKVNYLNRNKSEQQTVSNWLQQLFFDCINPLLGTKLEWLTVGDAYGLDAHYIERKGSRAIATDLNADFLAVAKEEGIISSYAAENAEQLHLQTISLTMYFARNLIIISHDLMQHFTK